MRLPRDQQVSDLLHVIADLVQEADSYLQESSLSPMPFAKSGKKPQASGLKATPFNAASKKDEKGKGLFTAIDRPPLGKTGLQPHKADSLSNRARRSVEGVSMLDRNVFRAKRERKARDRHHANKLLTVKPQKVLGSRLRKR